MDAELVEVCIQVVTIEPWASRDVDQKPTYGAAVNWQCRIDVGNKLIMSAEGRSIPTQGRVILVPIDATTIPGVKDRMTLPSTFPVRVTPILKVAPVFDESGLYHIEVYF